VKQKAMLYSSSNFCSNEQYFEQKDAQVSAQKSEHTSHLKKQTSS
jgi:hypothetical protein